MHDGSRRRRISHVPIDAIRTQVYSRRCPQALVGPQVREEIATGE